ncbi:hypothetical protein D9M71_480800 [compost metagenome]
MYSVSVSAPVLPPMKKRQPAAVLRLSSAMGVPPKAHWIKAAVRPLGGSVGGNHTDGDRALVSDTVGIALGVSLLDPDGNGTPHLQR